MQHPQPLNNLPLEVQHLGKSLGGAQLFSDVSLQLQAGETLAVVGESGSGKSTLLHLMAGLDSADSGDVLWQGENIQHWSANQQAARRLEHVGLVFQAYYLMPHLTARQNVELPFLLAGKTPDEAHCMRLLELVGVADKTSRYPRELSGGEQQRVAIARALALTPPLLLADEPTGNLDEDNADNVLTVLLDACKQQGCALVMVTHSERAAGRLQRKLNLTQHRLAGG
ncbi:ABC transporter ATP-binding protein [Limnobacter humi]|uniref:ABC transporter ATP-binding protein n=1 Tax=Limnobacter humi TaxID=1778671 RepID=A0ABT1WHX3_9BURK|nr:ABC transporter ATP-binding protein [Limnobacter humi]MCQ8897121.1 ABC transporter ATP-binding protein [Limnobacter humi]